REWVPHRDGGSLYIRPVYFGTGESLMVHAADRYCFVIITSPGGAYFSQPIRLLAEETYVRAFPGGTGDAKTAGNYGSALLAAKLAQSRGYHNVMWLDGKERRYIEESGVMNIMFVINGVAVTPPLSGTILPGVTRDSVLTLLRDMNSPVEERSIPVDEFAAAHAAGTLQEAFGIGTAPSSRPSPASVIRATIWRSPLARPMPLPRACAQSSWPSRPAARPTRTTGWSIFDLTRAGRMPQVL